MKIVLDPEFAEFVQEQIRLGRFQTAEEVVAAGLARLKTEPRWTDEELKDLREEVQIGVREADRGEFVQFTADQIIAEGREILAKRQEAV